MSNIIVPDDLVEIISEIIKYEKTKPVYKENYLYIEDIEYYEQEKLEEKPDNKIDYEVSYEL